MAFDQLEYTSALLLARKQGSRRKSDATYVKSGSNGQPVRQLQKHLNDLGYNVETDGDFGTDTQRAVKEFQKEHGAAVDGVVGQETFGKLTRAKGRPSPHTSKADTGLDALGRAVGVQGIAKGLGNANTPTGSGSGSRGQGRAGKGKGAQLKRGQARDQDGKLYNTLPGQTGSKDHPIGTTDPTKAAGNKGQAASNPDFESKHPREGGKFAKKGDSGDQTREAQTRLNRAGYKTKVDGEFGPKTDTQVKKFQTDNGLAVDGVVGLQTTRALKAASRKNRKS